MKKQRILIFVIVVTSDIHRNRDPGTGTLLLIATTH